MSVLQTVCLTLLLSGCHATFKRNVGSINTVNAQSFTTAPPHVNLGNLYQNDIISLAVNTYQTLQENRAERRIREGLNPEGVTTALTSSFGDALGNGPPFGYTNGNTADATVQMEIQSYGMEVPYIGAQGVFEYRIRVRAYRADGRSIYKARTTCSNAAGAPRDVAVAFGTVNNVRQLEQMSDAQIQGAFDKVAEWCAWEVVRKMRKHGR